MSVTVAAIGADWPARVLLDARQVRLDLAELAGKEPNERLVFYPRSFSYHVSPVGLGTDMHLYGNDVAGRTVAVRATGFSPYFFLRLEEHYVSDQRISWFLQHLNDMLIVMSVQYPNGSLGADVRKTMQKRHGDKVVDPIVRWQRLDAIPLKSSGNDRGYNGDKTAQFVQVYVYAPAYISVICRILEHIDQVWTKREPFTANAAARDVYDTLTKDRGKRKAAEEPDARPEKRSKLDADAAKTRTFAAATVVVSEAVDDVPDLLNPWEDEGIDIVYDEPVEEASASTFTDKHWRIADALRRISERGCIAPFLALTAQRTVPECYDADVDFTIRFSCDSGYRPEEAVEFTGQEWQKTPFLLDSSGDPTTGGNTIAFAADWKLFRRADETFQDAVPPQICLSFDCEMETGPNDRFPTPLHERILQICCVAFDPVVDSGCLRVIRRAFILGTSVELPAGEGWTADEVYVCPDEHTLLLAWAKWTTRLQPDMLTGWNIENFDLWYIIERAKVLGIVGMPTLCRMPGANLRVADRAFQSSAHGTHLYKEVVGEGLWVWDLFQAFKRSSAFKLRSYSLGFVSTFFLEGDTKEEVKYKEINGLQQTAAGRFKLMKYCMKDALLPAKLIGKLTLLVENIEQARATGVPISMICSRGLQIRLASLLTIEAFAQHIRHVFYTRTQRDRSVFDGKYEGAYVHKPKVGYHAVPVVTLDFKSLYPSIMVTKNICVKTLMPGRQIAERCAATGLERSDLWIAERNALPGDAEDQPAFVKYSTTPGLIPRILQRLLDLRARAKKQLQAAKNAKIQNLIDIFEKRQLAMKLNCNGIYGVFGAKTSRTYCPEMAATVTSTGRDMIQETITLCHGRFTRANGYPYDALVIYGDTDSVFILLSAEVDIEMSAKFGIEMAAYVTQHFQTKYGKRPDNIIELDFEKTFSKLILYAPKRYTGWKWELLLNKELGRKVMVRKDEITASGMETERRDSCLLVSEGVREVLSILLGDFGSGDENKSRVLSYIWNTIIAPLEQGTVSWHLLIKGAHARTLRWGSCAPPNPWLPAVFYSLLPLFFLR